MKNNNTGAWLKENLFQVIGFLMILANLWLAYQLAPTANKVLIAEVRLSTVEAAINSFVPRTELEVSMESIEGRLDRIEKKVDEILSRLSIQVLPLDRN